MNFFWNKPRMESSKDSDGGSRQVSASVRPHQVRSVKIRSTGAFFPKSVVKSEELDRKLGLKPGHLEGISGVHQRHFVTDETNSEMGANAIKSALESAGLSLRDIDAIIGCNASFEQPLPCSASLVQRQLGKEAFGIPCFDINSTCLSFVTGLDTVSYLIQAGRYKRVVFVSSETASVGLNYEQHEACSLFGDGAVAVIVEKTPEGESSSILAAHMETYSEGADYCMVLGGGSKQHAKTFSPEREKDFLFHMDGRKVFKLALQRLPDFMNRLFDFAHTQLDDFTLVIPHQASRSGMELIRKKLGIREDRYQRVIQNHGNMIAASIPFGLHTAIQEKQIKRGDKVLLVGTSAGFSMGGVALEY